MRFHTILNARIETYVNISHAWSLNYGLSGPYIKATILAARGLPKMDRMRKNGEQLLGLSLLAPACSPLVSLTRVVPTGACTINRPCAQQYVGKSQSCMVISAYSRLLSAALLPSPRVPSPRCLRVRGNIIGHARNNM